MNEQTGAWWLIYPSAIALYELTQSANRNFLFWEIQKMPTRIDLIMYPVRDYDEAIGYFVDCLGFRLTENIDRGQGKRWVVVRPADANSTGMLLAKRDDEDSIMPAAEQDRKVRFFLRVDDFTKEYNKMRSAGVQFLEEPRYQSYGAVAVFEDLYRNKWDLLGPANLG